jgi:hypothetical protein
MEIPRFDYFAGGLGSLDSLTLSVLAIVLKYTLRKVPYKYSSFPLSPTRALPYADKEHQGVQ